MTYRFSVIAAVFGVEQYLDAFLESLVNQSLGFREHIEVILVDDGSQDGSAGVIARWVALHPENIRYVKQAHGGQGSARNRGLAMAAGEWVTFIDPDDYVARDYFEVIERILGSPGGSKVGLVCCNLRPFDEARGNAIRPHPLGWRFQQEVRIVPVSDPGPYVQLSASTSFLLRKVLVEHDLCFDTRITPTFEDAHFVGRYLLCTPGHDMAFAARAVYFYRKRRDRSSTIDTAWGQVGRFREVLSFGLENLLLTAQEQLGQAPVWIQRMVLYDLSFLFKRVLRDPGSIGFLDASQRQQLDAVLQRIFAHIDSDVIDEFELAGVTHLQRVGWLGLYKHLGPARQVLYLESLQAGPDRLRWRFYCREPIPTLRLSVGREPWTCDELTIKKFTFLGHFFANECIVDVPVSARSQCLEATLGDLPTLFSLHGEERPGPIPIEAALAAIGQV